LAAAVESRNLFPAWESLFSDIPAGDEKIAILFYSVEREIVMTFSERKGVKNIIALL
jgi:hypothetical protein